MNSHSMFKHRLAEYEWVLQMTAGQGEVSLSGKLEVHIHSFFYIKNRFSAYFFIRMFFSLEKVDIKLSETVHIMSSSTNTH